MGHGPRGRKKQADTAGRLLRAATSTGRSKPCADQRSSIVGGPGGFYGLGKENRAAVVHGVELWGREHPGDVLPLLQELQDDDGAGVRSMVVHVLGQISYKEGCLEAVCSALRKWHNRDLLRLAAAEIREVHSRYAGFAAKRPRESCR